ncbi:MAG: FAD-binding protein [Candidatus Acetothermia bacterium]
MINIDQEKCTGCGQCIKVCPTDAISLSEKDLAEVDRSLCISCGACVSVCPTEAISTEIAPQRGDTKDYRGVWVFGEVADSKLKNVVPQLLGKGRELAEEFNDEVSAVLLGSEVSQFSEQCAEAGAKNVYVCENPLLEEYDTNVYTTALSQLIQKYKPRVVLYGATHLGRDLAPSVAGHLGLGLTADCTGLSIREESGEQLLLQTRPAFGGNLIAEILCPNTRPQTATVRPNVFPEPEPKNNQSPEVIEADIDLSADLKKTEILETLTEGTAEASIENADVIVAGGRGVGSPENFELLEKLAKSLNGVVGCSRPVVEDGWMSKARQVGQSGKTVSPTVYIACGISGAIQHKVGIRDSDTIIAINKNPDAPIFELADLSIVGDLHEVVPELIEQVKGNHGS